jgi:hypothetical protein
MRYSRCPGLRPGRPDPSPGSRPLPRPRRGAISARATLQLPVLRARRLRVPADERFEDGVGYRSMAPRTCSHRYRRCCHATMPGVPDPDHLPRSSTLHDRHTKIARQTPDRQGGGEVIRLAGTLMPKSGRLILTKAVLSMIPTYTIMATQLPVWAIEEIDKLGRKFFWAGHDSSVRGKCLVSWPIVCLPTAQGGLGVVDFRLVGIGRIALRTRWMWLQQTDLDRAWAALPMHVNPDRSTTLFIPSWISAASASVRNGTLKVQLVALLSYTLYI